MGTHTKHNEISKELDALRDEVTVMGLKQDKIHEQIDKVIGEADRQGGITGRDKFRGVDRDLLNSEENARWTTHPHTPGSPTSTSIIVEKEPPQVPVQTATGKETENQDESLIQLQLHTI